MIKEVQRNGYVLSLIDIINLVFLLVLTIFTITTTDKNLDTGKLYALYAVLLIFIVGNAYVRSQKPRTSWNAFNVIAAALVFVIMYGSLSKLLPAFVGSTRFDQAIDNLDKSIFGISPSVWMQRLINPVLTEVLYILYIFYFLMPVLLIIFLFRSKKFHELEISLFVLFLNYYGAYICYFYVPVEGPRYYLIHEHTKNLDGLLLGTPIRDLISYFEPSTLDCFPSLHASILTVITMLAARYYRKIYFLYLALTIIIIFSLVYLRYHYLLDIVTGITWAVISVYGGQWIYHKWNSKYKTMLVS